MQMRESCIMGADTTTHSSWRRPSSKIMWALRCDAIAEKYNESMLNSPNDCKMMKNSLFRVVNKDCTGVSPPKRGRKKKIPLVSCLAILKQLAMLQVAVEGEASVT
jgi:hypothetical protein